MIKSVDRSYGYPTSGGVPTLPANPWAPSVQDDNGGQGPYTFSVANATQLLASHGWKDAGGVLTCQSPGAGAAQCGAGVKAGTRLSMSMDYAAGVQASQQEAAIVKSDMAQAGIRVNLVPRSSGAITGESAPCKPGPKCTWDILDFGGWNFDGPGFEPTGEPLFATGAFSNSGGYSDPRMDSLINQTHTSDSLTAFQDYATYVANQLPFIWMPNAYAVAATTTKIANVGENPLATTLPEDWYFTR
jgi:peptide/nickel transport system substrate-binding protein